MGSLDGAGRLLLGSASHELAESQAAEYEQEGLGTNGDEGGRAARETFAHGFAHWGSGLEGRTQGAVRADGPVSLPTWPQEHEEGVAPRRTSLVRLGNYRATRPDCP